jgi:hypothetical protein
MDHLSMIVLADHPCIVVWLCGWGKGFDWITTHECGWGEWDGAYLSKKNGRASAELIQMNVFGQDLSEWEVFICSCEMVESLL